MGVFIRYFKKFFIENIYGCSKILGLEEIVIVVFLLRSLGIVVVWVCLEYFWYVVLVSVSYFDYGSVVSVVVRGF